MLINKEAGPYRKGPAVEPFVEVPVGTLSSDLSSRTHGLAEPGKTGEEMRRLLWLTRSADTKARDAALESLLQPEEATAAHWFRVLEAAACDTVPLAHRDVLEVLLEWVASLDGPPDDSEKAGAVVRFISRLPRDLVRDLFQRGFPLKPFLQGLPPRSIPVRVRGAAGRMEQRKRWQSIRKRLSKLPQGPAWAEITLGDLYPTLRPCQGNGGRTLSKAGMRAIIRPLLLPAAMEASPIPPVKGLALHWGTLPASRIERLRQLLELQAEELRAIRDFADEISRRTGRVVLSLHNATLAAAGGWAFEPVHRQFPSAALRDGFEAAVRERVHDFLGARPDLTTHALALSESRFRRLFLPKIAHVFGEWRMREGIRDPSDSERQAIDSLDSLLTDRERARIDASTANLSFQGVVRPHQKIQPEAAAPLGPGGTPIGWAEGFVTLASMVIEGDALIRRGDLPGLVLPWIDKFFVSSLRDGDICHLPAVVTGLRLAGASPLILLWEDTARAVAPSMQLGIERMRRAGHLFRGIGVFDREGSHRKDALDILLGGHRETPLFALEPLDGPHNPAPLGRILADSGSGFFRAYDSSWKDNLCFLYTGTSVAPLVSIQTDLESYPGWMAVGGAKYPAGKVIRTWLRRRVFGEGPPDAAGWVAHGDRESGFFETYARWANLG